MVGARNETVILLECCPSCAWVLLRFFVPSYPCHLLAQASFPVRTSCPSPPDKHSEGQLRERPAPHVVALKVQGPMYPSPCLHSGLRWLRSCTRLFAPWCGAAWVQPLPTQSWSPLGELCWAPTTGHCSWPWGAAEDKTDNTAFQGGRPAGEEQGAEVKW